MKLSGWKLQVGGLAIALGVGIFIGKVMDSGAVGQAAAGGTDPMPPRASEGARKRRDRGAGDSSRFDAGDRTEVERELQAILETPSQLQRTKMLLRLLERLPEGEFAGVFERIKKANAGSGSIYNSERLIVLHAWVEQDPIAATTYLQSKGSDSREQAAAVGTWATIDPEGAFAWATAAEGGGNLNNWLVGALRGTAATDPNLARSMLGRLEEGRTRDESLLSIQSSVTQFGYDFTEEWITRIDDETLRRKASSWLADDLTKLDPERAAAWSASIEDQDTRRDISGTVANLWASRDLQGATAWVESLPQDTRIQAVDSIARQYGRQDPAGGAEWLAGMGNSPDLDTAKGSFIYHAYVQDPAISLAFVSNLSNESDQLETYNRFLGKWMKRDPEAARTWAESNANTLPEEVVERFQR